jgi:hypothetical protein
MGATTFDRANEETVNLMNSVRDEFHRELGEYGVQIGLIMAYGPKDDDGNVKKPALSKNGTPCAGQVRIVGLKDRLLKDLDVEIILDGDYWVLIDEPKKRAILDHELEHIVPVLDKKSGKIALDDLDRPKLKLKKDDIIYWGISTIAARHGLNSQEVICYSQLNNNYGPVLNPPTEEKK